MSISAGDPSQNPDLGASQIDSLEIPELLQQAADLMGPSQISAASAFNADLGPAKDIVTNIFDGSNPCQIFDRNTQVA
jgi:hypothetical protein